jgi:hypothetical protein
MGETVSTLASAPAIADHAAIVEEVTSWLTLPADLLDRRTLPERDRVVCAVAAMNAAAAAGDQEAYYQQQLLLNRIYQVVMQIVEHPTAEGSVVLHEVTRMLESATMTTEDGHIGPGTIESAPIEPTAYLSWLKEIVRGHRAFKHPYYTEFINRKAKADDLRTYVIQESLVDGRFDDFLAMMQVGTAGTSKMEIANNFWDEMGNGDPGAVHTHLFNKIYEVFDIDPQNIEGSMTACDLLSGNLAVLLCRYRHMYPEAVGYLGMTEWLVPDRFTNVVRGSERVGLRDGGITYNRRHITVDSQHAAGWFHNVVLPAATSEYMRRGIARGALWRVNSSARHLDERLAGAMQTAGV